MIYVKHKDVNIITSNTIYMDCDITNMPLTCDSDLGGGLPGQTEY